MGFKIIKKMTKIIITIRKKIMNKLKKYKKVVKIKYIIIIIMKINEKKKVTY